ncbi:MAG: glycosyltransferase family 4 protein [Candidatus Thermoplasmatota archaeon]|nr:glycosyltransferase family 4 protein [Candidatus Thermoplasmatota archaeon]MBS3817681.1 glycosyltransferase family 4 protein [Candidatus Thermoplasmatota archaeon]
MKIAQLSPYFYPHLGGVESHVLELSKQLINLGHEVFVVTTKLEDTESEDVVEGVPVKRVEPLTIFLSTPIVPGVRDVLLKEDYDILHSHSPPPLMSFLGVRSSQKKDVPFVLTYHCDLEIPNIFGPLIVNLYQQTFGTYTVSKADKIITTTTSYGATSKAVWYREADIIPNAVDTERFHPSNDGSEVRKKLGLNDEKLVTYVGRIVYHKGLEYFVRAAHHLKDENVKFLLVGTGDFKSELENIIERNGLENKVMFAGRVPNEDLQNYYAATDIFVLPSVSRLEAFGIVALEAMASGVPVIVSDIPGVRDVIVEGKHGLLTEPMNSEDLAGKIRTLLENPDMAESMGKNGRERVKEKFTWKKVANRIEQAYKSILNG